MLWQLPPFLLQSALLAGGALPLVTDVAAAAAWFCCTAWQMSGLQAAAIAATGAHSPPAEAVLPADAMLPVVLDAWLQLTQQQLVQGGLLQNAACARAAALYYVDASGSSSSILPKQR